MQPCNIFHCKRFYTYIFHFEMFSSALPFYLFSVSMPPSPIALLISNSFLVYQVTEERNPIFIASNSHWPERILTLDTTSHLHLFKKLPMGHAVTRIKSFDIPCNECLIVKLFIKTGIWFMQHVPSKSWQDKWWHHTTCILKKWPDKWWDLILTVGELFSNLTLNLQDLISRIRAIFNCVNSVLMCCDATFSFVLFLNIPIFCSSSWCHSLIEQLSLCWLHVHTQTNPHHLHSLPRLYCRNRYSTSMLIPSLWYSLIQFDILYHPPCRPLSFRCLLSTVCMR